MLFAGIIVNEVVIRPWKRAGETFDRITREVIEMREHDE
jgi:hypothetical protein